MPSIKTQYTLLSILLIGVLTLDNNTLSNYLQIQQTKLVGIVKVDFDQKVIHGNLTYTYKANEDGSEIILDTNYLDIHSIKNNATGEEIEITYGNESAVFGKPLVIKYDYKKGDEPKISISYSTTPKGVPAQFLTKEQTEGKEYPYFFSMMGFIQERELLPIQDTPAVKLTVELGITVPKPLLGLMSGLYQNETDNNDGTKTYYYIQKVPIPSYLIAFAAGKIEKEQITDRFGIYTEKELMESAKIEFNDTDYFISLAEEYLGEFVWGEYNILILPRSFSISGMENPTLTFLSPSMISGDKSLVDINVHELIHNWIGNLVTNENWADFWLNEGITKYVQRQLIKKWRDEDFIKLDAKFFLSELDAAIKDFGENSSYTSLHPNLTGIDPNDAYSEIPYEKGFNFMYYVEKIINKASGEDLMAKFLKSYVEHFKYQSVDIYGFMNYFNSFLKENNISESVINQIDWQNWIFEPGYPKYKNDFSNKYGDIVDKNLKKFYEGQLDDALIKEFNSWATLLKTYFLRTIKENEIELTDEQHKFLSNSLNLKSKQNTLITWNYLLTILERTNDFLEGERERLQEYVSTNGAVDYLYGIYEAYYIRDKESAKKTFNDLKSFYQSMALDYIEKEFERGENFPFIEINNFTQVQDKKEKIPANTEIKVELKGYKESIGEIKIDGNNIFLVNKKDKKKIGLNCVFSTSDKKCVVSSEISDDGEYFIKVPRKIQTSKYVIKPQETTVFMKVNIEKKKSGFLIAGICIGVVIVILVVAFLLYRRYNKKKQSNDLIEGDTKLVECE